MSNLHRITPALVEFAAHERIALCDALQAQLPRLEFHHCAARLETVLDELGAQCQVRSDGALILSLPLANQDDLYAVVRPGAWMWR